MKHIRIAVGAALLVAAVAGCSSASASDAGAETEPVPTLSGAVQPSVGQCWNYDYAFGLNSTSDGSSPVDCGQVHTAQTVYVTQLPADAADPATLEANVRGPAQVPLFKECEAAKDQWLAGDPKSLLNRFHAFAFSPDADHWAAGDRWWRCDVVLIADMQLQPLPANTRNALAGATPWKYARCETANQRWVTCESGQAKRVAYGISYDLLKGPDGRYPSRPQRFTESNFDFCRSVIKARYPNLNPIPSRELYAFTPSKKEWKQGARSFRCVYNIKNWPNGYKYPAAS